MEILQLQQFKAIAEYEHITKASESLYISQPALSLSLKRLEDELGISLFTRSGRNIRLNAYGKAFLKYANAVLSETEILKNNLASIKEEENNHVGLISSPLSAFPNLMRLLVEACPRVTILTDEKSLAQMEDFLLKDKVDLAVSSAILSQAKFDSVLLAREPFCLVVSKSHPFADLDSVKLTDLMSEAFVSYPLTPEERGPRSRLMRDFAAIGCEPKVVCEVSSQADIIESISYGQGIGIVPKSVCNSCLNNNVKALDISDCNWEIVRYLYWKKEKELTPAAERAKEIIITYFRENMS